MPYGRYLNEDHEIVGKLLEQMGGMSQEDKIHDVLCAACSHNFHSPKSGSVFSTLSSSTFRTISSSTAKTIYEYLSMELGEEILSDTDYIQSIKIDCDKAISSEGKADKLFRKKGLDFNIEFSNRYYSEDELGIEKKEFTINLNPQKQEPAPSKAKKKEEKVEIRNEQNFVNASIENFRETFGPHFTGNTIEEILEKELSRNPIATLFASDSKQMNDVFKAAKELNNPKSELDDSQKAINLKNALDEYLIYKRDSIEDQLNKCENNGERKKLIDKNNIDFRRYEFCRKLSQQMTNLSSIYHIGLSDHDMEYEKYTAYERAEDAVLNGINRIQVEKEGFSLGKFFKEKIFEPIGNFFSSIFSRNNDNKRADRASISSNNNAPENDNDEIEEDNVYQMNNETNNNLEKDFIYIYKNETKEREKEEIKGQKVAFEKEKVNEEPDFDKNHPFTNIDKVMINDLFNNSSGSTANKIMEISFLSRIGLIKFENFGNEKDPLASYGLNSTYTVRFRSINSSTIRPFRELGKEIADIVGIDKYDVPDNEEFIGFMYKLADNTTDKESENKHSLSVNYFKDNSIFKTTVLETATKYDSELKDNFDEQLQLERKQIKNEIDDEKLEDVNINKEVDKKPVLEDDLENHL